MASAPLSLQPPPAPNRGPQTVADFIQRVNAEPGGFRGLDQDELRRQIEASRHNAEDDVEMLDAEEDTDAPAAKTKELVAAREDLMRNIVAAQRTANTTLDFISLLLSKELPVHAAQTLNNELRNLVGIGTLGATALAGPTSLAKSRVPDSKMTAIGMRLQAVTKAADSLESAAKRLEREITLETTYWNEVRAASERGWSVFRHPDEPHTMGVKFGFSNAAADFKASSIAPMRRADDGAVRLEHGPMTGVPKRLQVVISQDGAVMGQSYLPQPFQDDVKEARDTVFAQELWHELNRESRTLLARNVRLRKDEVTYFCPPSVLISFRLVDLTENSSLLTQPLPYDAEADRINNTLHLLLVQAHRQNEHRRSAPASSGPSPTYPLLLPIITSRSHEHVTNQCIDFFTTICSILRNAGITSSFSMTEPHFTGDSTEALALSLLNPVCAEFDLTITPFARLRIITKTTAAFDTRFQVILLPPLDGQGQNALSSAYPPASQDPPRVNTGGGGNEGYDSASKLFQYIRGAVPRAVARLCHATVVKDVEATYVAEQKPGVKWTVDMSGTGVMDENAEYGARFYYTRGAEDPTAGDAAGLKIVTTTVGEDGAKTRNEWTWGVQTGQERRLEDIVRYVLINGPTS
ncbi:hypothetical protein OQA88_6589 [Cercophora sp. LCS_1]